jgi:hypothetical protein
VQGSSYGEKYIESIFQLVTVPWQLRDRRKSVYPQPVSAIGQTTRGPNQSPRAGTQWIDVLKGNPDQSAELLAGSVDDVGAQ